MRGNASHARNYFGHFMPWARDLDGVQGWEWFDGDVEGQIIDLACAGGLGVDGDHLESASPLDPSFWPVHPTLERLWQFKKMAGLFDDETWPEHGYAQVRPPRARAAARAEAPTSRSRGRRAACTTRSGARAGSRRAGR